MDLQYGSQAYEPNRHDLRNSCGTSLAASAPSEPGFASNGSMNPDVQLPAPNGSLGHTRGQANCATARWKALVNAAMHVHVAWNDTPHNSDGTAEAVGSHNVSNTKHFPLRTVPRLRYELGRVP